MRSGNLKQQNNTMIISIPILNSHTPITSNIQIQKSNFLQKQNVGNSHNFYAIANQDCPSPTKIQVVQAQLLEHNLMFAKNGYQSHRKEEIPRLGKPYTQDHDAIKLGLFSQCNFDARNFSSTSTQNSKQALELWEEADQIIFKSDSVIQLQNPQIHNIKFNEDKFNENYRSQKQRGCHSKKQSNYQTHKQNIKNQNISTNITRQLQEHKSSKLAQKGQHQTYNHKGSAKEEIIMPEMHAKSLNNLLIKKKMNPQYFNEDKLNIQNPLGISSQKDYKISSLQSNQSGPKPKIQLQRLLSSAQISQLHKNPEHLLSQSMSPKKSFKLYKKLTMDPSPTKMRSQKQDKMTNESFDYINYGQNVQPIPSFLTQKKKQEIKNKGKVSKFLPINSFIKLKVLSKAQIQVCFFIVKLLADNDTTTVYLVCEKATNFIYCLKKCEAKPKSSQFDFLVREGKVGQMIDHSSLLKTYCTLYDDENIYQLIEYMEGMTLFEKSHSQRCNIVKKKACKVGNNLRNSEKVSSESSSNILVSNNNHKTENIRLILTSLLKGAEYLHKNGIIHRDIKPSNIFITHENILKIGDFGSCGFIGSKQYVGTLDYVAPQILLREKYNQGVDLWAIGCIAYELWVGLPPFFDNQRQKTLNNIIECRYDKQKIDDVSLLCLINSLLQKNSEKRLSALEALQHPFLQDKLRKRSN